MTVAGIASNVWILGIARIFTGVGIGGLSATSAAVNADFCNSKYRSMAAALVAGGFAFGAYIGATFLAPLLREFDWRITFYLGAGMSCLFLPVATTWYLNPSVIWSGCDQTVPLKKSSIRCAA